MAELWDRRKLARMTATIILLGAWAVAHRWQARPKKCNHGVLGCSHPIRPQHEESAIFRYKNAFMFYVDFNCRKVLTLQ